MQTGGDRGERDENASDGSGISRRHFVAGSLFAIGGTSMLVEGGTRARFSGEATADGSIGVVSIRTAVSDLSDTTKYPVYYQLQYSLGIDTELHHVRIIAENQNGGYRQTFTETDPEGWVPYQTYDHSDTELVFTFELHLDDSGTPVFTDTITDTPDGTNPDENEDMGGSDPARLEQFTVADLSNNEDGTRYDVSYQVSGASGFSGFVRARFRNTGENENYGNQTIDNSSVASGTISYPEGGAVHANHNTFEITVEVVKQNGLIVDSQSVLDDPNDGSNSSWSR